MITAPAADIALAGLSHLGDRLECAAAAGVDAAELDPLIAELDHLARSLDPASLNPGQRGQVAAVNAKVDRILSLLSERQVQAMAQDRAAQSRDSRVRQAYGAGR